MKRYTQKPQARQWVLPKYPGPSSAGVRSAMITHRLKKVKVTLAATAKTATTTTTTTTTKEEAT